MSCLDVLIVGAGPTGLLAAAELLRHGASVRILDRLAQPSPLSRALGVHARSLEILDEMGAAEPLIAAGLVVRGALLWDRTEPLAQLAFDELDSRFPFVLCVPQSTTERVLDDLVARRGGKVERGVELHSFTHSEDCVAATVQHADGRSECIEARFLLGCDGAHSLVRRGLGLDFEGNAFPDSFLLADVTIAWDVPRDRISTFFSPEGLLACFPLPNGQWRLIGNQAASEAPVLADVQAMVAARAGFPAVVSEATWLTCFRIHTRQVARYRTGRVFLAGDAAHIHSPVGGQGMNTGMQDAHNLAWKLAAVANGSAPPSLLDSYHDERHRIGKQLLRSTELATRVGTLRRPLARALRDQVAHYLASLEVIQRRIARGIAELTLSYAGSPIVDEHQDSVFSARVGGGDDNDDDESPTLAAHRRFAAGPHAGERVPDAVVLDRGVPRRLSSLLGGGQHTVLLFDGRARTEDGYRTLSHVAAALEARHGDAVRLFTIVSGNEPPGWTGPLGRVLLDADGEAEDAFGAAAECAYVIRPDLYIGHRSQPASQERILAHLSRVLLPRSAEAAQ
jgi:2-polyprenyl-6-methoxyphenol hydroxylase-like FAD-dependent oxidoreductase